MNFQNQQIKHHFKSDFESYKHYMSKLVLGSWLKDYTVKYEHEFKFNNIIFIPDLTCLVENRIDSIYEVIHKHDLDKRKLGKIQMYQYYTGLQFNVFSVSSEYIMRQVKQPDYIFKTNYTTKIN